MRKGIKMTGLKELMEMESWQGWGGLMEKRVHSGRQDSWHHSPAHIVSVQGEPDKGSRRECRNTGR